MSKPGVDSSQTLRPFLPPMEDGDDLKPVATQSVWDHVRCARYDQFPGTGDPTRPAQAGQLARYAAAADAAMAVGLGINAGHDLNRANLTDFLRGVPGVQEVSIGHALIADALELGYTEAVRDYQRCIQHAYAGS